MTNHDDLCENLPRYMFHIDDAGRASMKQDPIGAYIHIADLKQALKLSGSCEGITKERIRNIILSKWSGMNDSSFATEVAEEIHRKQFRKE